MFILGKRTVSEMQRARQWGVKLSLHTWLGGQSIACCITLTGRMTGKNAQITGKLIHHYAANVGKFHKKERKNTVKKVLQRIKAHNYCFTHLNLSLQKLFCCLRNILAKHNLNETFLVKKSDILNAIDSEICLRAKTKITLSIVVWDPL